LNERANQLARELRTYGAGSETRVAVCAERGINMLVAIIGVLKAGAAYVPLDPSYPIDRLQYIFRDSKAQFLITERKMSHLIEPARATALWMDRDWPRIARRDTSKPPGAACMRSLAYVIYTSGSTGKPKGVLIEHRGMVNHLWAKVRDLGLDPTDRVAQTARSSFDISVWQFLAPLIAGSSVEIIDDEKAQDGIQLARTAERMAVSVLETVPVLLGSMLDRSTRSDVPIRFDALRWMVATGEALPRELCWRWVAAYPGIPLLNAYGPTECSDDVTHFELDAAGEINSPQAPIGRPLQNTRAYVLDSDLRALPAGIAGELYIGGDGVGRGYQDRADLTADRFIPDPFGADPGGRLYRTGDLVQWKDGELQFLGRIDGQVKIRGNRIELGEIEAVLSVHPGVVHAAVTVQEDPSGIKRLVAYLVCQGEMPDTSELSAYLNSRLPDYMCPAAFIELDRMPVTPSGKVDRKAFPRAEFGTRREASYTPPTNAVERALCQVWEDVLRIQRIGIHDNFFEMGGDSILSVQIVARAGPRGFRFTVRDIFQHQTVADLARVVNVAPAFETAGVPPAAPDIPPMDELGEILAGVGVESQGGWLQ